VSQDEGNLAQGDVKVLLAEHYKPTIESENGNKYGLHSRITLCSKILTFDTATFYKTMDKLYERLCTFTYLFIYSLLNDTVSNSDYIALNDG
jgi:hypothetical protein